MRRRRFVQRVDVGLQVPGLAIPEDEPHDAGLQAEVGSRCWRRSPGELHPREERSPRRFDGTRVGPKAAIGVVQRVAVVGVGEIVAHRQLGETPGNHDGQQY